MRKHLKTAFNYFLIILFIILGLIGLALPFVPQLIFFAIALILISYEIPAVERYIETHLDKNGIFGKIYLNIKNKVQKYLR